MAAALAYSEGAWSADDTAAGASSVEPATSPVVADSAAATTVATIGTATSDTTPDDAQTTSNIPSSSSSAPTTTQTTPETTQPADTAAQASGYADGVHMGTAEYTEWGDVQVQVTIRDGAIIEIEALEYPTGRRSSAINNEAIPMLEAEAIAWQTADLDVVSGATYTSWTYAASLQAALDQAALAATQEADTA